MSTVTQSRKDIKYLASLVRGLTALDEELDAIGSLEKMAATAKAAADEAARLKGEAVAAQASAQADLKGVLDKVARAEEQASTIVAQAKAAADEARKNAQEALRAAQGEAYQIKQAAQADADRIVAERKATADALARDLAGLATEVEAAMAELADARTKRDDVLREISRLKARFAP